LSACGYTYRFDRFLDASDPVSWKIVYGDDVPRLRVGTRHCFTYATNIGPFMPPSSTKGATIARCRRPATNVNCFPMPVRCVADQPLSSRTAAAQTHHAGARPGLVNTSRVGSNVPCCRIQRRRAQATSGCFCSAANRVFLKLMFRRSKNRHAALRLPAMPFLRMAATISSNVKSPCLTIRASRIPRGPPAARCCRRLALPQRYRFPPSAGPKSPLHSG
jgi:hypothetical protein